MIGAGGAGWADAAPEGGWRWVSSFSWRGLVGWLVGVRGKVGWVRPLLARLRGGGRIYMAQRATGNK